MRWNVNLFLLARCLSQSVQAPAAFARRCVSCDSSVSDPFVGKKVSIRYEHGFPIFTMPLPSRKELCQFTLRPVSDTVAKFCDDLISEDKGIDLVVFYLEDGTRIAGCTPIENLLRLKKIRLRINDTIYTVSPPERSGEDLKETSSSLNTLDDIKSTVASLHAVLNLREYKASYERRLREELEQIEQRLHSLEKQKLAIDKECESHSEKILWSTFAAMGIQMGLFARLTWWEYSWDIMEPITYFATYATVIGSLGYYLYTRQSFEYPEVKDRIYTLYFHKRAVARKFDVVRYNKLIQRAKMLRHDLERLHDPLSSPFCPSLNIDLKEKE
ncbi:hypothetical protein AB6A40_006538 [Gnathostoma spinigerum]|uniref:Calcium uniporter protein n=1 Tax=Gnathostoma spinigerum TaxID=75299 RepID=A0ABD6EIN3_9BILA